MVQISKSHHRQRHAGFMPHVHVNVDVEQRVACQGRQHNVLGACIVRLCINGVLSTEQTKSLRLGYNSFCGADRGPFKCYVTLFVWKLDPHPPPRNANNIEPYTFVMLFPGKIDTPHPHLRYVTLEWPLAGFCQKN